VSTTAKVTKALILSAGQGSRLLPLTADRPKCLVEIGGRPLLDWQISALAELGVEDISVVVGFRADAVDYHLKDIARPGVSVRTVYNPFYKVAENIGSCWLARHDWDRDFILLNGDVVFEPAVAAKLMAHDGGPVTVTVDHPPSYDADDMKVRIEGGRLTAIGKTLSVDAVDGESIGMMGFRGKGPALFAAALDEAMRLPEGIAWWYTHVIDRLARRGHVDTVSIDGLGWGEVDFPHDLERVEKVVSNF
jgi:choline kinase